MWMSLWRTWIMSKSGHILKKTHTYEWVMSQMWMSHVTHMNRKTSFLRARSTSGLRILVSRYVWVMAHIWVSHVTHMNESCHTYGWVMSVIAPTYCHVTHKWVMSHIWMSHDVSPAHMCAIEPAYCNTLATHCTTLHHTASHCTTLHHTAPHCNTLWSWYSLPTPSLSPSSLAFTPAPSASRLVVAASVAVLHCSFGRNRPLQIFVAFRHRDSFVCVMILVTLTNSYVSQC